VDASDRYPPSVKLLLDAKGDAIDNPTIQVQPNFNGGNTEQLFKWYNSLSYLMEGQSVGEHYSVALQALRRTNKDRWQRRWSKTSRCSRNIEQCRGKAMVRLHHEAYNTCVEGSHSGLQASTLHGTLSMDRQEYRYTKFYGSS
jgi:hypothetical protein